MMLVARAGDGNSHDVQNSFLEPSSFDMNAFSIGCLETVIPKLAKY